MSDSDSSSYYSDSDINEHDTSAYMQIALEALESEDPRIDIIDEYQDLGPGRLSNDEAIELLHSLGQMSELERQVKLDTISKNFKNTINPTCDSFYKMSTKVFIEGRLERKIKQIRNQIEADKINKNKNKKNTRKNMSREQCVKVKKRAQTDIYLEKQEKMEIE